MASSENFKAPPSLKKSSSYESWQKELQIWQAFTNLPVKKQGPAIFLTLEGKAKEAALELDVAKISSDTGVAELLKKLDELYLADKVQTAYEAYDAFEKFHRPAEMSMSNFIIEFERLLNKTKHYGTIMSSDILAYRLLKSANVSEHHQELARATVKELTYDEMKDKLKKIFGQRSASEESFSTSVKVEPTYEVQEHDTMYGKQFNKNFQYR